MVLIRTKLSQLVSSHGALHLKDILGSITLPRSTKRKDIGNCHTYSYRSPRVIVPSVP